ncbi:radical SAM protein [Rhizobium ruizarguesonis]
MTAAGPSPGADGFSGSARFHLFTSAGIRVLLDVESGSLHEVPKSHADTLAFALRLGDPRRANLTAYGLGMLSTVARPADVPKRVSLKAISLAVAQKCNLGCTYCYAQQGTFGGSSTEMTDDVARAAVDQLLREAQGRPVTLAFMGGEPLVNRKTLHAATRYAAIQAAERRIPIGFSLTTNATLVKEDDIRLFDEFAFTLTVSVDGFGASHDQTRPYRSGKGSFEILSRNLKSLFAFEGRRFSVLARVTVTPQNLRLPEIMNGLLEMGFDAVMFSPMLSAPNGKNEMDAGDLERLLDQLKACGGLFREGLQQGRILPFSNLLKTLQRIHSYERDDYPCGAGGGYMGVSASGGLYACHRFVDDEEGRLGDVFRGVDSDMQESWLAERHLEMQTPCRSCWARRLCAGSCHYETIKRGRPACDYIRGWLNYCLEVYVELAKQQPETLNAILTRH